MKMCFLLLQETEVLTEIDEYSRNVENFDWIWLDSSIFHRIQLKAVLIYTISSATKQRQTSKKLV